MILYQFISFVHVCDSRLNCLGFMIHVLELIRKSTLYTSFIISYTVLQFLKKKASWFQKKVLLFAGIFTASSGDWMTKVNMILKECMYLLHVISELVT